MFKGTWFRSFIYTIKRGLSVTVSGGLVAELDANGYQVASASYVEAPQTFYVDGEAMEIAEGGNNILFQN